jgi:hypothetical protein
MKTWKHYAILTVFAVVFMGCPTPDEGNKTQTPTATDFDIGNLSQIIESVTVVTITPKQGKSTGSITIYYEGTGGTTYAKNTTLPAVTVGDTYTVTFDVAAVTGWEAATGLSAGTLRINDTIIDDISNLSIYLSGKTANTKTTPYYIALNITDNDFTTLRTTLINATSKYVYLDLSGSTITTIPENAFVDVSTWEGCTTLTGITIPNRVISIGKLAFLSCYELTSVTIPSSITSIGDGAFQECFSLTSITIPNSITKIGDCAFLGTSLTSITIPNSVTNIGAGAFSACTSLTAITISTNNTAYIAENGVLYNKEKTKLIQYPAGKTDVSFTIPNSVTNIEDYVFLACEKLASITIPNSVTGSIGRAAFESCRSLTGIIIPNSVTGIGEWAFNNCTSLSSITFQGTIASDNFYTNAFYRLGDLRDKFYATDSTNGTPGTYTTTVPVSYDSVWEKQP